MDSSLRAWIRRGAYIAIAFFALGALFSCLKANAQPRLSGAVEGGASVWANPHQCYQHSMDVRAEGAAEWGVVHARTHLGMKWWGACDSKIPSSPLSAEAGKVIGRRHGIFLGARAEASEGVYVRAGVVVRRHAVHHIWKNADRTPGFPRDGSWRAARKRCQSKGVEEDGSQEVLLRPDFGLGCPRIGYQDGARLQVGLETGGLSVQVSGPPYQWKNLTLPWPRWTARAEYQSGSWHASAVGQAGGPAYRAGTAQVLYRVGRGLWIGPKGGRVRMPGWGRPFDRIGIAIRIRGRS